MSFYDYLLYKVFGGGGSGGGSGGGGELKITDARYLFISDARIELIDKFCPLIADCTNFSYMFSNTTTVSNVPAFDTSKGDDFSYMFYRSNIASVTQIDSSNGKNFTYMFNMCKSLKTVYLNLNKMQNTNYMFSSCSALSNLYLYNIRYTIQIGSGTSWGHLLTVDSLVHTIKELCTVTSSQTLTMGTANLAKIAGLYCKIIDDTTEKKPMELCESTDEGAMTLSDYAMEKNWVLA